MRYIVWNSAKGAGDLHELDADYSTKRVTNLLMQSAVPARGCMDMLAGNGYNTPRIVSQVEYDSELERLLDQEAVHNQERDIEAAAPIEWKRAS